MRNEPGPNLSQVPSAHSEELQRKLSDKDGVAQLAKESKPSDEIVIFANI